MIVAELEVRRFRNLSDGEFQLGGGLTVVHGPNGAGKTNLLEALFVSLTGTSPRTNRTREVIRFGEPWARVAATVSTDSGDRELAAAISRSDGRHHTVDGRPSAPDDAAERPAVAVFMPDRMSLVKGPPQGRRAHLDSLASALVPRRLAIRRRYATALAQRNALISRIRAARSPAVELDPWDVELASAAIELRDARAATVAAVEAGFSSCSIELGLGEEGTIAYRPRVTEPDPASLAVELGKRRSNDLERGHTTYGPHLDELVLSLAGRSLRNYASQGQQRIALLALLLAERDALAGSRGSPPLLLLDDVMSELDPQRRRLLCDRISEQGQALITATELDHVPQPPSAAIQMPREPATVGDR